MGIHLDPVTRQRIPYMNQSYDLQYDMVGDSAVTHETVPVIGPWSDDTGSDLGVNSRNQQMWAGIPNELEGTDPAINDDARVPQLNEVGQNAGTTRRRRIIKRVRVCNKQ